MQEDYFATIAAISKAQLDNGSYKPITRLSAKEKADHKDDLEHTRRMRRSPQPGFEHLNNKRFNTDDKRPIGAATRGTERVFDHYALQPGMRQALSEKTRESKVHRGVHYGESISAEHERVLDSHIDPKMVRHARRSPVAIHRGKTAASAAAGATGAHVTTGGKGRVILSDDHFSHDGKFRPGREMRHHGVRESHVINHELAHTTAKGGPWKYRDKSGRVSATKAAAEEGRADGMSRPGRGLYERIGSVAPKGHTTHGGYFDLGGEGKRAQQAYHGVHERVQSAFGNHRHDPEDVLNTRNHARYSAPRPFPKVGQGKPLINAGTGLRKPAIIGGAAAAAMAAGGLYAAKNHGKGRDGDGDGKLNEKDNR